jgi:diguanylate cyclase (GGDEF)-like protein
MGHLAGDILLKTIAERLQKSMRSYDTVGRISGDEFVVVANDLHNIQEVIKFVEKIRDVFREYFDILGQQKYVTSSIGVAVFPIHGTDVETLLRMADTAMYMAKKAGKDTYRFFSESKSAGDNEQNNTNSILNTTMLNVWPLKYFIPRIPPHN